MGATLNASSPKDQPEVVEPPTPMEGVEQASPEQHDDASLQVQEDVVTMSRETNGDVGSRSSVRFWITLVVGGARHTDLV